MGKWYVSEINSAFRLMRYEVVIKEKEKIVGEGMFKMLVKVFGVPEIMSNCCGAEVKDGLCEDCLEHCTPVYIFG